jgi:DNA helicase-2/ATP-dependent DNA helicase PcrA
MTDLLADLNPEQRRAASHLDGPLLVVAGAGTGKTRVIAHRIAYLIQQGKAKPSQVLALTFTEKAAQEMAERLYDLIGYESFTVPVLTFNAFGAELLGRYGNHIGRATRGGLINDTQKLLLLRQHLDEISLEYYGLQSDIIDLLERVVGYIGRLQNAGITPAAYRSFVDGLAKDPGDYHAADIAEQRDLVAFYELYEKIKAETGTFDYYDQLAIPLRALEAKPNLAERLRKQYPYVLVDEYQDTSPVQDALLRRIVPPEGNIFAVGDDDQAIYGFRGADIENILHFTEHFKVAKPLALTRNYRSGQPILDAAYRLIRNNDPERLEAKLGLDKQLTAVTDEAVVEYRPYRTASDEQNGIVEAIAERVAKGESPAEIAVLARSNAMLRIYAKALRQREIPFAVSTTVNIFEQRELINLWYLLEWIGHKASDEAITHVILGPFIGWSATALRLAVERSQSDLSGMEAALRGLAEDGDEPAAQLIAKLELWRGWAEEDSASRVAYRLVFETGLSDRLITRAREARTIRVFDDLHRFLEHIEDYVTFDRDPTISGYLATFPKPPELEVSETLGDVDGVQLLTVHAAKGLEFGTVYVVNTTAKSWSEQSSNGGLEIPEPLIPASELPAIHEQRRLMYVAATRAKRGLYLSSPAETAGGQRLVPSPFIEELMGGPLPAFETPPKGEKLEKSLKKLQRFYPLQAQLPDHLPFERADGWIELGINDLGSYEYSPHDFYLQKVLGIVQPFGPHLAFGSAIHGAIQAFYEGQLEGETPSLEELKTRLDELWSDRGYGSRTMAETAHKRAYETIKGFRERELATKRDIQTTESPIRLEIPEAKLRLRGRLDATIMTPEGLEVRDFKTGGLKDEEKAIKKAKDSFQLRTYALAIEELSGTAPAFVTLDYVVTGVEGQVTLTAKVLANHREKLITLAARLRARDFEPGAPSSFKPSNAFKYYGEAADEEGEGDDE